MNKIYNPNTDSRWHRSELAGKDAADFLHRITTLHIHHMKFGLPKVGCILNPQGKFEAYFYLTRQTEDHFIFEYDGGPNDLWHNTFLDTIERFHFAEKFTLKADAAQDVVWMINPSKNDLEPPYFMHQQGGIHFASFWDNFDLQKKINFKPEEFELLRLQSISPKIGKEITNQVNPLEIGLQFSIDSNKGCYPGQEIIEKIISLGSPARRLVLLKAEEIITEKELDLYDQNQLVGQLTSKQNCYALGLVRKTSAKINNNLQSLSGKKYAITEISKYENKTI